jgi:hypothetical protein
VSRLTIHKVFENNQQIHGKASSFSSGLMHSGSIFPLRAAFTAEKENATRHWDRVGSRLSNFAEVFASSKSWWTS